MTSSPHRIHFASPPDPEAIVAPAETWLIDALASYGAPVMFVLCFASCLALPVPASLAMITAGTIAAAGDLSLWQVGLASLAGALAGDQVAYAIGRAGRGPLTRWNDANAKRRDARLRAEDWLRKRGGPGVLLSRWPISPLGPYVNFAAGAAAFGWRRFTLWDVPGEVIWVLVNTGLGYFLSGQITAMALLAQELAELILAGLALLAVIVFLRRRQKKRRAGGGTTPPKDRAHDLNSN